jgi:predicted ABC-type ATPase
MRVFAGPNGSGKTTLLKGLLAENNINLGVYVNADDIELGIALSNTLNFADYQLVVTQEELRYFFKQSSFSPTKRNEPDLSDKLFLLHNCLVIKTKVDSYLAADLAEFIRQKLLITNISFTYETVMSHPGKIDFFRKAQECGYKVYLYFIATQDPEINVARVITRVAQNGHPVAPDIINKRYFASLQNLHKAVKQTNRAFIFDNSERKVMFIAEIKDGSDVLLNDAISIPAWVNEYLLS